MVHPVLKITLAFAFFPIAAANAQDSPKLEIVWPQAGYVI